MIPSAMHTQRRTLGFALWIGVLCACACGVQERDRTHVRSDPNLRASKHAPRKTNVSAPPANRERDDAESRTELALGGAHSCHLRAGGEVFCWGSNQFGQLGDPSIPLGPGNMRKVPGRVLGLVDPVHLAAGAWHTCAVDRRGAVSCWGHDGFGQLGDAQTEDRREPVKALGVEGVVQIGAGEQHTCARLGSGAVSCWGANQFAQLGDGTTGARVSPVRLLGIDDAEDLAVGRAHGCVQRRSGAVVCWGFAADGQLGDGTRGEPDGFVLSTTWSARFPDIVELALRGGHGCLRRANGDVYCWGRNDSGQLGTGETTESGASAFAVQPLQDIHDAVSLAIGSHHTCIRKRDGTVVCVGYNGYGQLGDGTTASRSTLQPVVGLTEVSALAAGVHHTCAARRTGGVVCWGYNHAGELGDGTTENRLLPTETR